MKVFDSKVIAFDETIDVEVHIETYTESGALAIELVAFDNSEEVFEPYGRLTVNLEPSADGEVYIKDWNENESWALKFALDNQIITGQPTYIQPTGYVNAKRYALHPSFIERIGSAALKGAPR